VTGATGFVGRYVVRELLRRRYRVRALARSLENAAEALPTGQIEVVHGDIFDGKSPAELLRGADACIHLIGIIREAHGEGRGGARTFEKMHVGAVRVVLGACQDAGVGRIVHMSALGASPDGRAKYQRSKYEGERLVRRSGLAWTVFRPSLIHGAESELVEMIKCMASGQQAPWYFMPYFSREVVDESVPLGPTRSESAEIQPVAVEDVAWCFAEALERHATIGEVYNLVGPDVLTWPELLAIYRDNLPGTNRELPIGRMPGTHGIAIAKAAGLLGLGGLLPFDAGQAAMAMEDSTSELGKVRAHLGLSPRRFVPTVLEYAAKVE
jgi:NADH dehydrogenase